MDFFHTLLSFIFPPSREEARIASLSIDDVSGMTHVQAIENGVGLFRYEDEVIRSIVWELKYKKNTHAIHLIASALGEYIAEHYDDSPLLIPIPLSPKRRKERGYNQVEEVVREICKDPLYSYDADVLTRIRETTPQTQLGRKERLTNLSGAFGVPDAAKKRIEGWHLILIDDVATTGATLSEARRTLLRAGARRVDTLAFAH